MTIEITFTPAPEVADEADHTGLTEDAYLHLTDVLSEFGWDIEIRKGS